MGLFDALRAFTGAVDREYDRRVKAASNVKNYDPTGESHHHGHVTLQNEQVVAVEEHGGADEHGAEVRESTPAEQAAPREVTHH
jgi:hypothetical protein